MILLDEDFPTLIILNIPENQISKEFIEFLESVVCSYKDDSSWHEDMYSIEDVTEETGQLNPVEKFDSIIDEIKKLIDKHDCSFFRIIKTSPTL